MRSMASPQVTADGRVSRAAILVVEDDPEIRGSLRDLLVDDGFSVSCCENGYEALDLLGTTTSLPGAIILDLMLPVMDGWEFRLRQRTDARLAKIPVLAISADSSAKAAAIDANAYLRKPFRASDVLRELETILGQRDQLEHTQGLIALGTVAAEVAHEVKNPLTYILGNLNITRDYLPRMIGDVDSIQQTPLTPQAAEACASLVGRLADSETLLRDVGIGVDRIHAIAQDLGLLVRRSESDQERIGIQVAVESAVRLASHHIRHRARLVRDYQDAPVVVGDRTRLTQVFLNLLVNASQALRDDRSSDNEIRVKIHREEREAVVDVEDTGVGIPAAVADQMFEPFFTTKAASQGTGLGLSISRRIVLSHGGRLEFDSEPGKGSRFRVILPIASSF